MSASRVTSTLARPYACSIWRRRIRTTTCRTWPWTTCRCRRKTCRSRIGSDSSAPGRRRGRNRKSESPLLGPRSSLPPLPSSRSRSLPLAIVDPVDRIRSPRTVEVARPGRGLSRRRSGHRNEACHRRLRFRIIRGLCGDERDPRASDSVFRGRSPRDSSIISALVVVSDSVSYNVVAAARRGLRASDPRWRSKEKDLADAAAMNAGRWQWRPSTLDDGDDGDREWRRMPRQLIDVVDRR